MKKIILFLVLVIFTTILSCESKSYDTVSQPTSTTDSSGASGTTTTTTTDNDDDDNDDDNDNGSTTPSNNTSTTNTSTNATVTYTKDVAPIITANCLSCHSSGGTSPVLSTYTQVKNATGSGGKVLCCIQASGCKVMPPSGKMSTTNINIILSWSSQGYTQ